MTPGERRVVYRRRGGEVLMWLGILTMLAAATTNHETTGNQFLALFGGGVVAVFAGLALTFGRTDLPATPYAERPAEENR